MGNAVGTSLEHDLRGSSRDGLYRALSYLERLGAPVVSDPAEVTRMQMQATRGLEWLTTRANRAQIVDEYEKVVERWSPTFKD